MPVKRASIEAFAAGFDHDFDHAKQVAKISGEMFDACRELHRLGKRERELLVSAALLHDIGWVGGQKKHHKRSLELILEHGIDGASNRDLGIIANVARYHRKTLPKLSHADFVRLSSTDRKLVQKLAALIRVADGLDRTHQNLVSVSTCSVSGNTAIIGVETSADASPEFETAREKSDLFWEVFGLKVEFLSSNGG